MRKKFLMRFTAIFLLTFIFSFSFARDYKQAVREEIAKQFGNAANEESILLGYNHFVVIKGDTFVVPNGYHYVFKVDDGKVTRLDQSTFHGGNFGRFLFSWNKTIYALGGYGFFNTNNNLEYFNEKLKGWSVEKTKGELPSYIHGISYQYGGKIVSFNNFKSGNAVDEDIIDSSIYSLDLKSKQWIKKEVNKNACLKGQIFYFKDYVICVGDVYSIMAKKEHLNFIKFKNNAFGLDLIHNLIGDIEQNKLILLTTDNHKKVPLKVILNLDSLWSKYPKQKLIVSKTDRTTSSNGIVLGYLFVGGLILSIVIYVYRKKTARNSKVKEYNGLELKLIAENRTLNTEELDELLGIEHMDAESKKFKRNRMINEMNQRHSDFITRIKDDTDKRRYLYQIKK